jgi:hypothetical protein
MLTYKCDYCGADIHTKPPNVYDKAVDDKHHIVISLRSKGSGTNPSIYACVNCMLELAKKSIGTV